METTGTDKDDEPMAPPRASSAVFTIEFGEGRNVDLERHKTLVERYQKRHRRGLSASKLEEKSKSTSSSTTPTAPKKLGFTRKSSSSVEGSSYDVSSSEDQRSDRAASIEPTSPLSRKLSNKRERLSLPLKSAPGDTERMVQSFTDYDLNSTCNNTVAGIIRTGLGARHPLKSIVKQLSSPECEMRKLAVEEDGNGLALMIDGPEFDFDRRSDSVSEAGTYTIDADIYTTEQKERMSIDRDFRILDPVAGALKAAEYVNQLAELNGNNNLGQHHEEAVQSASSGHDAYDLDVGTPNGLEKMEVGGEEEELEAFEGYQSDEDNMVKLLKSNKIQHAPPQNNIQHKPVKPTSLLTNTTQLKPYLLQQRKQHNTPPMANNDLTTTRTNRTKPNTTVLPPPPPPPQAPTVRYMTEFPSTKLSPILSPTTQQQRYDDDVDTLGKTFTKIMFPPSPKGGGCNVCTTDNGENIVDQGSVISVTSSGAFRARNDLQRKSSLTKSDIYVEAYTDHQMELRIKQQNTPANTLSANLVHMTSTVTPSSKVSNLPPSIGGKSSPTKIPSPSYSRPRSRNSGTTTTTAATTDCSLDTECYLKPTQQLLSQLEKRLEVQQKQQQQQQQQQQVRWNNDCIGGGYLLKRPVHVRHNSLDGRGVEMAANKLEHFQRKNLLCIDQTTTAVDGVVVGNGFGAVVTGTPQQQQLIVRKVQNSPNNSPMRRSSSFSAKHQQIQQQQQQQIVVNRLSGGQGTVTQLQQKEVNVRNSPVLSGTKSALQKSASTTNIKAQGVGGGGGGGAVGVVLQGRRGSITCAEAVLPTNTDHQYQPLSSPYHQPQQCTTYQPPHHKIDRSKYGVSTSSESSSENEADDEDNEGVSPQRHLCGTTARLPKQRKDITSTRYNRAFSLRRGRLEGAAGDGGAPGEQQQQLVRCPNTPEMRRKFGGGGGGVRATSVDRKPSTTKHFIEIQPRYLQHTHQTPQHHSNNNNNISRSTRHGSAPPGRRDNTSLPPPDPAARTQRMRSAVGGSAATATGGGQFHRGDTGRFSVGKGASSGASGGRPMTNSQKTIRTTGLSSGGGKEGTGGAGGGGAKTKQAGPRSNSSLSSKEVEFANWKRRKSYDPMKAAAEGKKRAEVVKKQLGNSMTQSFTETTNQNSCDSSPSHSSSVHRSQSFHGTAVTTSQQHHRHRLLLSSGDEEDDDSNEDLTLSANDDDGAVCFSPPTPSPSHQPYPSPWQREMQRQTQEQQEQQKVEVLSSSSDNIMGSALTRPAENQ